MRIDRCAWRGKKLDPVNWKYPMYLQRYLLSRGFAIAKHSTSMAVGTGQAASGTRGEYFVGFYWYPIVTYSVHRWAAPGRTPRRTCTSILLPLWRTCIFPFHVMRLVSWNTRLYDASNATLFVSRESHRRGGKRVRAEGKGTEKYYR